MSKNRSKTCLDLWIKPSFDVLEDNLINKDKSMADQKSRKRQMTDRSAEDTESDPLNRFQSDSISLLDSVVTKDNKELAFSRYKCNELSLWFNHQFIERRSDDKFLLMVGPTGSGKTTSLKVLAEEFNVEVIEYNTYSQYFETVLDQDLMEKRENPMNSLNQIENFRQFLKYSVKSSRLKVWTENQTDSDSNHRLVLIEEFPNVFYLKPETLHKELKLLEKRFGNRLIPIVFIISETSNGQSEEYKLLPKALQIELKIQRIAFTPVSDISLNKILHRLSDNQLSKDQIQNIIDSSSGDVRSAINNLHLVYMHKFDNKSDKKGKKLRKTKPNIDSNVEYVSRDSSLTTSHAIGKVLYAKRMDVSNSGEPVIESEYRLPEHLKAFERIPLNDCPESISEKLVVSSDVFNSWLFQNYIEFCDSLDGAHNCIDWLCQTDALFSGEHHFNNKSLFDSYQSSLSMRGLMFNLTTTNYHSMDTKNASNGNQCKPKRQFKPFEKPKTFVVNRLADSLKQQICQSLAKTNLFYGIKSVVNDLMPFLSLMPKHKHPNDTQFRYCLYKTVTFEQNFNQFNEHELCNALSQSSFNNRFEQKTNTNTSLQNQSDCKREENTTEMEIDLIDDKDYEIEDFDSD